MKLSDYEKFCDSVDGKHMFDYYILKLCAEAGEVAQVQANCLKGKINAKEAKLQITYELGDVMWYLVMIAHRIKIPLEDIMETNKLKLMRRYERS